VSREISIFCLELFHVTLQYRPTTEVIMRFIIAAILMQFSVSAWAQILIEDPAPQAPRPSLAQAPSEKPRVGRDAAVDYFKKRETHKDEEERSPDSSGGGGGGARYMSLHLGTFLSDKAYRWGNDTHEKGVGETMFGVTYRVGEWKNSMDLLFRGELMSYDVNDEHPLKLSVMPIIAFPDARSTFPLYFGAGAGLGIFFKQADDESDLSLDYAVLAGARFPDLFDDWGMFVETGIKGQVFLLSNGQQQGVFLAIGGVFTF
jgi:hypothetical protein